MNRGSLRGIFTALISPFHSDGSLDWAAYEKLIRSQIAAGIHGVVPVGTTGESPVLTTEEKKSLILKAVELCKGSSTQVVAGTGSNDTQETVEFSRWASDHGVNGVLVVTPYYNKPSASGMEEHFTAVANEIKCPLVLYNVPGRTGTSLTPQTISRLAKHPRITAIKEASGNLTFASDIMDQCREDQTQIDFLSGDDATFLASLAIGAVGTISVASNLFPKEMVALQAAWDRGDAAGALKIHSKFYPLFRDLFVESNPVPIKAALSAQGVCSAQVRAPLTSLTTPSKQKLNHALQACGFKPIATA